ncbi:MAG: VWA domain-containing protein [Eubacterium sp.]|nr:VWA domain-containing protein [Eubacterium sp.]
MTFGSLVPLVFLVGVPIIIILYLLKPKGIKKIIPSLMLWKEAERNERSATFARKLIRNILMFLEIAALLLLMFAAMSPAIKMGKSGYSEKTVIIIDTSGSMSFKMKGSGSTRFEQAILDAKDYVDMSSGEISIVTCGGRIQNEISSSRDKVRLKRVLSGLKPTDESGDISKTESVVESLDAKKVLILTDGDGAKSVETMAAKLGAEVRIYGESACNVGISQLSIRENEEGLYDIAMSYLVTGEGEAVFDVSLYDENDNLIEVRTVDTSEHDSNTILMLGKKISGNYVKAQLSSIRFKDTSKPDMQDGLDSDNTAYAVVDKVVDTECYLVGAGNIYFEKAYMAATGKTVVKTAVDSDIEDSEEYKIAIYDRADLVIKDLPRLVQGYRDEDSEKISGGMVTVKTGDLITDMADYTFGASDLNVLKTPDWAVPLMVVTGADGTEKTVAYYGEKNGIKIVVLGFDIRNSELPLMAEFPIFVADAVSFLSNDKMIQSTYISAGDSPGISHSVSKDAKITREDSPGFSDSAAYSHAGLYKISDTAEEYFVVRYPSEESDGSLSYESYSFAEKGGDGLRLSSLRWLCLLLALILLVIDWIIYAMRNRVGFGLDLSVRLGLILLILLALFGIRLPGRKKKTATIFVVDMSGSVLTRTGDMQEYLRSAISSKPEGEKYGIVTFGKDVITDQFVSDDELMDIASNPDPSETDIESAVKHAVSMIPDDSVGRIVVLTDGKETIGDIQNLQNLISEENIEICARMFEDTMAGDVYIEYVDMPDKMAVGDTYTMKVNVYSSYPTDAVLKVWNSSEVQEELNVSLSTGENTFVIKGTAGEAAIEQKRVTVEAAGDAVAENNSVIAASIVEAPRSVLLVSGLSEDSSGFEKLLKTLNVNLTVVSAINAPGTMMEMLNYKTIILDNVFISDMSESFVANLENYVKDYGGGLIVTGGKESFAPGGYRDTILDEILPVSMLPKGINEAPSLALVMVIDCSGSMSDSGTYSDSGQPVGRSKIDVAVDAALEAVNNLSKDDYVGVLTFSDNFSWRQNIVKAEDKNAIKSAIEGIGIQGGTTIKPGLTEAAEQIAKVDAGVKHILLLTDGEGETKDFNDVTKYINDNNITMSTIAVGSDSDTVLLEKLAADCDGRYYYSDSSTDVPKIFVEEIYLSGDTYFKNGDFALSVNTSNELVSGLYSEGIPHISSYIATTAKPECREIIGTSEEDPLLACWQYGLGSTVAWTTNASGSWASDLAGMQDYAEMWKRILDYTCMESEIGKDTLNVYKRRDKIEVKYQASEYSEDTVVEGVYTTPDGETKELILSSENPGSYSATFSPEGMGLYGISVKRMEKGEMVAGTTAIETVQFSDEYRRDISDAGFVNFINSQGRMLDENSKVFTKIKVKDRSKKDISLILIVLSIILLLIDIFIRRFDIAGKLRFRRASKKAASKRRKKTVKSVKEKKVETEQVAEKGAEIENKKENEKEASKAEVTVEDVSDITVVEKPSKPEKTTKRKKKEEPETTQLDTSALLKKKRDRNL